MKPLHIRRFSAKDFIYHSFLGIGTLLKYKKEFKAISPKFRSNIMLSVTGVNGCAMCSYYHSKVALEEGMSTSDIKGMLSGDFSDAEEYEYPALLFGQHYADTSGNFDIQAYNRVVDVYGEDIAKGVLTSIRMIMIGNINGIAFGNLWLRLRFKKTNSFIVSDLFNSFGMALVIPFSILFGLFLKKRIQP
jgi:AhpD family alkylhydroperoxidase